MRIDLTELEVGQEFRGLFNETVDSRSEDVRFDAPVTGEVAVERTASTAHLAGRVRTTAPLVCGRCLTTYRQALAVSVDEEFALADGPQTRGELAADDFILPLGPESILDVTEVIRQHLLLALPMVPACRPDCRGLCPRCGTNWNERQCRCAAETVDPRFAPLLKLKDEHAD